MGRHFDRIGYYVLCLLGVVWRLDDLAIESPVANGIDCELHVLIDVDLSHVGFVDARPDLHLLQVFGDEE